jgi:hypothetical protein
LVVSLGRGDFGHADNQGVVAMTRTDYQQKIAKAQERSRARYSKQLRVAGEVEREAQKSPEAIPERFLAEAYAFYFGAFTQREWDADSWQQAKLEGLLKQRYDFPEVRTMASSSWLQERTNALLFAICDGAEIQRRAEAEAKYNKGHELQEISAPMRHHIDAGGPTNGGWMASELLQIGMSALGPRDGNKMLEWAQETARDRYRQGYYADPFTNNPRKRGSDPANPFIQERN